MNIFQSRKKKRKNMRSNSMEILLNITTVKQATLQQDPSDMLHQHCGIDYQPTLEIPTTLVSSKDYSKQICFIMHFAK